MPLSRHAQRQPSSGVVPEPAKIVAVLVATGNGKGTGDHERKHRVRDPRLITAMGHRVCNPLAHAELALGLTQEQQPGIRGLVLAVEINRELFTLDGWAD